jgi:hypothetical protein
MSISDAELAKYETDGAVTIDGPLTESELDQAEAAWDRIKASDDPPYEDPDYVNVIQHPFFEEVAKKVLRAEAAHLWWGLSPHERPVWTKPFDTARDQWANGSHVDIQATWEDFTATPRRMRCELWFWLNNVPADRGAMRILPGSHRPIMEHWSRTLTSEHKQMLPRVHGIRFDPKETAPAYPEHLPELTHTPWVDQEPIPFTAKRGQILVLCSAGLHSAWQNEDSVPRKAMGTAWIADGVSCGLPKNQRDGLMEFFPKLRERLSPDRAHIVPEDYDWVIESDYEPKWPEMFPAGG